MPWIVAVCMSVLATAGFLAFGIRKFSTSRPPSGLAVGSLALGSALLAMVVATYLVYSVPALRPAREVGANLFVPLLVYLGVFAYSVVRHRLAFSDLLFAALLGFVGLWFFGFYTGLLVACSFGDCL
jgi:hypothetical protein